MTKGKTILELMKEQEPLNDYSAEDFCQLYCSDGPMPCPSESQCSWLQLFTKRRFTEVQFQSSKEQEPRK
jgi:hypothetical protein